MTMRILVEQLNGGALDLEVTPKTTMREVKEQLKRMHTWEDELSRDTTVVELFIGEKKVMNAETVEELGLSDGSKVSVVFRKNVVQCSNKRSLGPDLDPEALVTVEIPYSEAEIEASAFEDCKRVAQVIIPSSVTRIGHGAFSDCASLVSVNIPDSVRRIATRAFFGCSALTEVNIPDSIIDIGPQAFANCSSLPSVSIPNSVTQIGGFAFAGCTSLAAVNIPSSVTQIDVSTFEGCASLVSMTIPDSVTEIEGGAFDFCPQLTLTAPARLLGPQVSNVCKMVANECGCGRCDWRWFHKSWVCPVHHSGQ